MDIISPPPLKGKPRTKPQAKEKEEENGVLLLGATHNTKNSPCPPPLKRAFLALNE